MRCRYPLFSYGESVSILIQNIILVLMMWHYGGKDSNDEPLTFSASHKLFVLVGTLVWVRAARRTRHADERRSHSCPSACRSRP